MAFSPEIFLGIDPTAGRSPYTWAVLDADGQLLSLEHGELEAVLAQADRSPSAMAAINAPPRPNRGLVHQQMVAETGLTHVRGADMRLAEHVLRGRGISVPPTPKRPEACMAWTQMGFLLHHELDRLGYACHPDNQASRQRLETNPHAVFCILLGQVPLPKPSLEGRLQRQLALHGQGEGIPDPMDFFEEITRHKILRGALPMEFVYLPEELDALAAAFMAWAVVNRPEETCTVGDIEEGLIALPTSVLKEHYPGSAGEAGLLHQGG
jgi:hypothetical protein